MKRDGFGRLPGTMREKYRTLAAVIREGRGGRLPVAVILRSVTTSIKKNDHVAAAGVCQQAEKKSIIKGRLWP